MKNFIIRTVEKKMTAKDVALIAIFIIGILVAAGYLLHGMGFRLDLR